MRTLLLNSSGEFLGVTSWQAALGDVVVGNVKVLEEYDKTVRSQDLELKAPAVVREVSYVTAKWNNIFRITHSSRNVFIRDHFTCQYCKFECSKQRFSQAALKRNPKLHLKLPSMDHVHPKSKGGEDTWENTVTACRKCNSKKADQLLKDTSMKLRNIPRRPEGFREMFEMKIGEIHELWKDYLEIYF
jgi:5-methylcytosine-specific restriction endonuclease McrA